MTTEPGFEIIMYHYVRDLASSAYPKIKGLDAEKFEYQLNYLTNSRQILRPDEVRSIVIAGEAFPSDACWLTFDDGYTDHFDVVFPMLEERNLKGSFFPPVLTTSRKDVLDVNKIHFILAAAPSAEHLMQRLEEMYLDQDVGRQTGVDFSSLVASIDTSSRYDEPNVILIKRLLQRDLPETVRGDFSDKLFRQYVSADISAFADQLYMSVEQLLEMHEAGHEVGIHGNNHNWLGSLSSDEQRADVGAAVSFFRKEGLLPDDWTMCFPYGSYNADTLKIVADLGCVIGLTTKADRSPLQDYVPLELSRLDTNDFPQSPKESS